MVLTCSLMQGNAESAVLPPIAPSSETLKGQDTETKKAQNTLPPINGALPAQSPKQDAEAPAGKSEEPLPPIDGEAPAPSDLLLDTVADALVEHAEQAGPEASQAKPEKEPQPTASNDLPQRNEKDGTEKTEADKTKLNTATSSQEPTETPEAGQTAEAAEEAHEPQEDTEEPIILITPIVPFAPQEKAGASSPRKKLDMRRRANASNASSGPGSFGTARRLSGHPTTASGANTALIVHPSCFDVVKERSKVNKSKRPDTSEKGVDFWSSHPLPSPGRGVPGRAPELIISDFGAVLQGGVSSDSAVRPGTWRLGLLEGPMPPEGLRSLVLAAPERPERLDLPKLSGVAWLFAAQQSFSVEKQRICFRQSENFVFLEGVYTSTFLPTKQEDEVDGETGRILARQSHVQGRARDGHSFAVNSRKVLELAVPMSSATGTVRYRPVSPVALEKWQPEPPAKPKQLAYLGLQDTDAEAERSPDEAWFVGSGVASLLDGAVLLTARHRYTAFAQLPVGCRPDQRITLVVARGLPNNQIIMERLDITPEGECMCETHAIHLCGVVFGVPAICDGTSAGPAAPMLPVPGQQRGNDLNEALSSFRDEEDSPSLAFKRLQELEARTESHRLTHSCFKGRSDFTQTGMLVFDTEEDLEGLNKAIAWLFERHIPVVLMERQTRIFPLIFDMDLKVTSSAMLDAVPERIKRARPWRSRVDFCRWHGADWFVLSEDRAGDGIAMA
eukprot:s868_g24.t1